MDPFTQRMLERAKSRREKLDNQKMILEQRSPLQERRNVNEKTKSSENGYNDQREKKEKQYITDTRKSKLQKLAQFYSTENENVFLDNEKPDEENDVPCDAERKPQCKLGRLTELANKIKEWEDDSNNIKSISSVGERNQRVEENAKRMKAGEKKTIWNSDMVEKLCSQGFSLSESHSKLLYNFENEEKKSMEEKKSDKFIEPKNFKKMDSVNEKSSLKTETSVGSRNEVLKKAAFFESTVKESPNKGAKDPAELSLAERKALFEKNKGEALLPRKPFVLGRKVGKPEQEEHRNIKMLAASASWPNQTEKREDLVASKVIFKEKVFHEEKASNDKQPIPEPPPMPPSLDDEEVKVDLSGEKEEAKEVKTFSPTSGRLYPSLSELDITDESEVTGFQADSFNESKNSNLCLNMTLSELLELNKNNPATPPNELSFSQSKECQVLNKMDKLLEDALNDLSSSGTEEDPDDMVPSPPKMKKSSSFEYKSGHGNENSLLHTVSFYRKQHQKSFSVVENVEEEEEADKKSEDENEYEKENESILVQNKIQTLIAEINKQQTIISQASQALNLCLSTVEFSGSGEQVEGERLLLLASHKRQACLNEVQRLKIENSLRPQGRTPFLTERGDVSLVNISIKLKRDSLRSIAADSCAGIWTALLCLIPINDSLFQTFSSRFFSAENLQYFVCLIKSDEQVLATPAVSATKENLKDMALQFPGQVKLEGLLSDFKITLEVYNLELSKELLPHDIKYHIVNKKEKKLLTPIKNKKSESKLVKPNIQSPAGPNAVRTSNFQMCGYIVFSLKEISRSQWILNKVPYVSPVEGTICMTIQSQLRLNDEFRGFLTMFDDISGFGAWHRRWCLLSSHFISYWKYPDDETKKVPIGTIDLRSVVTEHVGLVSRDICARLNTFLLETTRPRLSDDKNSLVVNVKDDITTIRHLLSADSKQEMSTWCKKLNTTLALLRSWKCNLSE